MDINENLKQIGMCMVKITEDRIIIWRDGNNERIATLYSENEVMVFLIGFYQAKLEATYQNFRRKTVER